MLILKEAPKARILALKKGGFFIDGKIVSVTRQGRVVTVITEGGSVFHAHDKADSFNVFKKIKRDYSNR
jgi:hypothetical protein